MVTATFSPMSIEFAADCDGVMRDALVTAADAMRELAAARRAKREAQMVLDDREAEITMRVISETSGQRTNAETRKAELNLALSKDAQMQSGRRALADAQNRVESSEYQQEISLKTFAGARSVLEYATAVVSLYSSGRELQ